MKHKLAVLFAAFLFSAAVPADTLLSPEQFTREYAHALKAARKGTSPHIAGPLHIKLKGSDGGDINIYLNNAYALYKRNPADKDKIRRHYVAGYLTTFTSQDSTVDTRKILPIVKTRDWLATARRLAREQGAKKIPEYPHETLTRELIVLYAEDSPSAVRYLTREDLDKAKLSPDRAGKLARENLRRILPKLQRHGKDGIYILSTGESLEASLLLMPDIWNRKDLPVKGEFVLAVPTRDAVIVTGSQDPLGLTVARRMAKELHDADPYRLTTTLFVLRNGRLEEFQAK